jgi:hypothetical protein
MMYWKQNIEKQTLQVNKVKKNADDTAAILVFGGSALIAF